MVLAAIGFSILLSCAPSARAQHPGFECGMPPIRVADGALRQQVMDKFNELCAKNEGIFSEDVTYLTAPYFPVGQKFDETVRVAREQGLRELQPFHGKVQGSGDVVYVTGFSLMSAMFSHVYVTIDLDYRRMDDGTLILRKSMSFLRTSNM